MSIIRDAARKHGGLFWREYDEQFQIRQAAYASSWARINSDLWLQIFAGSYQYLNNNQSTSGSNQSSLSNQSPFQSKKSLVTCRSFNQGYCSPGSLANLTTFAHLVGNLHMEPGVANNRVSQSCQYKIHFQGVIFMASTRLYKSTS